MMDGFEEPKNARIGGRSRSFSISNNLQSSHYPRSYVGSVTRLSSSDKTAAITLKIVISTRGMTFLANTAGRVFEPIPMWRITRKIIAFVSESVHKLLDLLLASTSGMNEDGLAAEKGKVSFVSSEGINQLLIFIFVLAVFHVLYCILTMALGRLKMRRWKHWEKETRTAEYQFSHGKEEDELSKANHDRANKILDKSVHKLLDLLLASTSGMNEDGLAAEKATGKSPDQGCLLFRGNVRILEFNKSL